MSDQLFAVALLIRRRGVEQLAISYIVASSDEEAKGKARGYVAENYPGWKIRHITAEPPPAWMEVRLE